MSGKEADVYVVRCGSDIRAAKVYKEAAKRNFKKAVQYTEGRKVKNSRRARAMEKGSKFGRQEQEKIWQNSEVDALYLLESVDVRVPEPFGCLDGVLLMELIVDKNGDVAPRLGDVTMTEEEAILNFAIVMQDVVRMLCAERSTVIYPNSMYYSMNTALLLSTCHKRLMQRQTTTQNPCCIAMYKTWLLTSASLTPIYTKQISPKKYGNSMKKANSNPTPY